MVYVCCLKDLQLEKNDRSLYPVLFIDYIETNGRLSDEFDRVSKEVMAYSWYCCASFYRCLLSLRNKQER
jgi:hypothetical protein